eukprot:UN20769
MTLISVKRLKYLRKYTDGNYKPSEDSRVKKAMQSVVTKNIENSDILPPLTEKERKKRQPKRNDAGALWAHLPATELTDEVKEHFNLVKARGTIYRDKFGGTPTGPT